MVIEYKAKGPVLDPLQLLGIRFTTKVPHKGTEIEMTGNIGFIEHKFYI